MPDLEDGSHKVDLGNIRKELDAGSGPGIRKGVQPVLSTQEGKIRGLHV